MSRFGMAFVIASCIACEGVTTQTVLRFSAAPGFTVPPGATLAVEVWPDGLGQHESGERRGPDPFVADMQLVVDAEDNDAARRFTVYAELRDPSGARISWARVRTGFLEAQVAEVRVELSPGCPSPSDRLDQPLAYDPATACGSHDSCIGGMCAPSCFEPEPFVAIPIDAPTPPVECPERDCRTIERVEIGWDNTCVLDDGDVFCWGRNGYQDSEFWLGRPSRVLDDDGRARPELADPITGLAMHLDQACVLRASGVLRCGGTNRHGQFGTTRMETTRCCTEAPDPAPPPFASIVTGGSWIAGLTVDEGAIWYSGAHPVRGLASGEGVPPFRPFEGETGFSILYAGRHFLAGFQGETFRVFGTAVAPEPLVRDQEREIEGAARTLCAISAAGELRCWGEGTEGDPYATQPNVLGSGWRAIAVSKHMEDLAMEDPPEHDDTHRCGIREDGSLMCWGNNQFGQLGIEPSASAYVSEPLRVGSGDDWVDVAVGEDHSCGIRAGGRLFCWGLNRERQLGLDRESGPEPSQLCVPAW